jgi:hypothetical protein
MRADIVDLLGDDGALDLVRAIENGSTHIIKKLTIRTRRLAAATGGSLTVREDVSSDPANNLTTTETLPDGLPIEETTYEIVLHDSQSAARHLARILHLEVKHRPIEARRPTDDELAHRMADLLERARAAGRREGAANQRPAQTMASHLENVPAASQNMRPEASAPPEMVPLQRSPLQTGLLEREIPPASPVALRYAKSSSAGKDVPFRHGFWNRILTSAPVLTFINLRAAIQEIALGPTNCGLRSAKVLNSFDLCGLGTPSKHFTFIRNPELSGPRKLGRAHFITSES